jgi:hypothetical protein
MVLTGISSLVLGGGETEQPSPKYFLLPVQVPIRSFASFQKWLKIPQWYSQVTQGV